MITFSLILTASNLCLLSLGQQYMFVDQIKSVNEAETYCQSTYGSTLASIHSIADNTEAQNLCVPQSADSKQGCSIGLNDRTNERGSDRNGWTWTDNTPYDFTTNWRSSEPNDYKENGFINGEDCGILWAGDGQWNDVPCDGPPNATNGYFQRFLCNYGTYFPSMSPTQTTSTPTNNPSIYPSTNPSVSPTNNPSISPTMSPITTNVPTIISTNPTKSPSKLSTVSPTFKPSNTPTIRPSNTPTNMPSVSLSLSLSPNVNTDVQNEGSNSSSGTSGLDENILLILGGLVVVLLLCIICMIVCIIYSKRKNTEVEQDESNMNIEMTNPYATDNIAMVPEELNHTIPMETNNIKGMRNNGHEHNINYNANQNMNHMHVTPGSNMNVQAMPLNMNQMNMMAMAAMNDMFHNPSQVVMNNNMYNQQQFNNNNNNNNALQPSSEPGWS